MITSYNDSNKALYEELFERMSQYSGKEITSLHEYLAALDTLMKEMSTQLNANNYNLLRLPLTEPVFEINPDTREIKVPDVFAKNGLTIQGDKLAEIVWFKMPRFFDLTDFYNFNNAGTKSNSSFEDYHTYIEWYNPTAKIEENQRGVDLAYAMTCDEDYIYFGWPLADKVSGESGNVQFTVRFLGVKDGEIRYNFSTKIQQCQIKTTLNFDLLGDKSYRADSWEDLIYTRPVYSGVVNSVDSPAPVIIKGLEDGMQDLVPVPIQVAAVGEPGDPDYVAAHEEVVYQLPLNVQAAAPNAVREGETQDVVFVWQHQIYHPENGSSMTGLAEAPASFKQGENPVIVDAPFTSDKYKNAAQSTYKVTKTGRYTVLIGNKLSSMNNTRYVYTGVVEVPDPTKVKLDDASEYVTRGYTDIVYTNQFNNEVKYNECILKVIPIDPVEGDTIHYQWKRYVVTDEMINGRYTYEVENVPESEGGNTDTINPTKEGKYFVEVTASRNGSTSEPTFSRTADVRKPPQSFGGQSGTVDLEYDNASHTFIASLVGQQQKNHKVKYIWYRAPLEGRTGADNLPNFTQISVGGLNGVKLNNNVLTITESGYYYVEGYEVVFDTEEDPANAPYTSEAIFPQRAISAEVTITDNLDKYTGE